MKIQPSPAVRAQMWANHRRILADERALRERRREASLYIEHRRALGEDITYADQELIQELVFGLQPRWDNTRNISQDCQGEDFIDQPIPTLGQEEENSIEAK